MSRSPDQSLPEVTRARRDSHSAEAQEEEILSFPVWRHQGSQRASELSKVASARAFTFSSATFAHGMVPSHRGLCGGHRPNCVPGSPKLTQCPGISLGLLPLESAHAGFLLTSTAGQTTGKCSTDGSKKSSMKLKRADFSSVSPPSPSGDLGSRRIAVRQSEADMHREAGIVFSGKLPCLEDTQAALWRDPCGKELRSTASNQCMHLAEMSTARRIPPPQRALPVAPRSAFRQYPDGSVMAAIGDSQAMGTTTGIPYERGRSDLLGCRDF
ncbi:uncharacterized protein LOC125147610 [Prionailurus viverrinus]|uniref:uncharacterized protein LOC125147610 n=1 Tax=Prionailurus viverrinus TaxID=61388 RepID=UPI001FF1DAB4|nr:uncharacterized protein LOC125147610 [Prionailurus viverrinus]